MTDYKQLCAELLRAMDELEECEVVDWSLVKTQPLKMASQSMAEVRAALAEPEPPSLKEQALQALDEAVYMADDIPPEGISADQADIIRRALEQLDD